jgi:alcohol dehydrogenase, propanol-preferring
MLHGYNRRVRAATLSRPGPTESSPLAVAEAPRPEPGPDELLIRVQACAVCRTDLQIVEGDLPVRRLPIVPGHQVVGTIAALGSGVTGWREGDKAGLAWLGGACGECEYCATSRENLCEAATFTGWDRDGGFAEVVSARSDFALPLPGGSDPVDYAPLLCGGVIGYRSLKVSGIQPGQRLGLYGFGASARLAIQVAVHWACEVYVATRSTEEQQRALDFGAAWAGGYDQAMPGRLHAAVTFAPVGDVVIAALRALAPGGAVAINAIHLDRIPAFDYDWLWRERSLRSVANFTRADAREFLELAAAIPIRTDPIPMPLAQANEALLAVKEGSLAGTAVLTMT